ncbi:hypothetical protein [uncultured Psychrosphaera sp.]|uniref:hypothetical protein n=1 Tax=uncultured Psychrosphaera sp. TaxID=1403522 RepID=UPI0026061228|nr:hypothetical protein [uncultured Psychrosphaera sp.]
MKFLTILISLLFIFSAQVAAHPDHSLTENSHAIYHTVFWALFAVVVYKGYTWFKNKKSEKNQD